MCPPTPDHPDHPRSPTPAHTHLVQHARESGQAAKAVERVDVHLEALGEAALQKQTQRNEVVGLEWRVEGEEGRGE